MALNLDKTDSTTQKFNRMKQTITLLSFLFCLTSIYAQDSLVILHPVIGDTISLSEKTDYLLFSEVKDNDFNYGILHYGNSKFRLHVYKNEQVSIVEIDSNAIKQYCMNVKILDSYNKQQPTKNEESVMRSGATNANRKLNTNYMTPEMKKKLLYDTQRHVDLRNEAEGKGLRGLNKDKYINSGGYYEIQFKKN